MKSQYCKECKSFMPPKYGPNGKLTAKSLVRIFCSNKCYRVSSKREINRYHGENLPTGTVGAMSELVVCADMMRDGWNVFRALSPNCPCDLIAMKPGRLVRIEVRTGRMTEGGRASYPWSSNDIGKSDVLAVVLHAEDRIEYMPPLEDL